MTNRLSLSGLNLDQRPKLFRNSGPISVREYPLSSQPAFLAPAFIAASYTAFLAAKEHSLVKGNSQ